MDAEAHKRRMRRILTERGLTSFMNDTKWRLLCEAVASELPFPPAYQLKRLDVEGPYPRELDHEPSYYGDWGTTPEALLGLEVEWLRVAPRYQRARGPLIAAVVEDCTDDFRSVLTRLSIPFSEEDGFFTIYGHASNIAL